MIPTWIGPYRVLAELGRGGAGRVFLAEETGAGFTRRVAVKVLAAALPDAATIERFRTEGRLLAGLEHPGIARLYDAGTTDDGVSFFAMELIEGSDLVRFAEDRGLGIRGRVELFLQVLEAVGFAHRNLIVHRDLKPGNLLVDAAGRVKLLDFGIARLLRESDTDPAQTRTGQRWLTPAYASPEQIRGERTTTAADIYSLGVVLYELLAGRQPFLATGTELAAAILQAEPPPPSQAPEPRPSSAGWGEVQGDLDAITLLALRKEPESRYRSTEAFAEDLRRYLEGFPVLARQGTRRYRLRKFVHRNRRALVAAVAVLLAFAIGVGSALWQTRRAAAARAVAERRFDDLEGLASAMIFEVADAIAPLDDSAAAMELTLERALEYLGRLEADAGDDPKILTSLAAGYEKVGRIAGTLPAFGRGTGRAEKAFELFDKGLALRRRRVALADADPESRRELGRSLHHFCGTLRFGRDAQRAAEICDEAVSVFRDLVEDEPGNPENRFDLAQSLTQGLIVKSTLAGEFRETADRDLDQASLLWQEISTNPPQAIYSDPNLTWGLTATSDWLRNAGRPGEALTLAERAVATAAAFREESTGLKGSVRLEQLSTAFEVLGGALLDLDRPREALDALEQSDALALEMNRRDDQPATLIRRFSLIGLRVGAAGDAGEIDRGERAAAAGDRLLVEAAKSWKPDTVTWSQALLERDRGLMYQAFLAAPDAPKERHGEFVARAKASLERAIAGFESLLGDGQDRFGAKEKIEGCREALAALGDG